MQICEYNGSIPLGKYKKELKWKLAKSGAILIYGILVILFLWGTQGLFKENYALNEVSFQTYSDGQIEHLSLIENRCHSIGSSTFTREQKCEIARSECEVNGLFNYYEFHYCALMEDPVISIIFMVGGCTS
jgi:hypothetical protein